MVPTVQNSIYQFGLSIQGLPLFQFQSHFTLYTIPQEYQVFSANIPHWFVFQEMKLLLSAGTHLSCLLNSWWVPLVSAPGMALTHWGWVTDICVGKLTITGSDNGLLPGRQQAIIWNNAGILLIGPLRTNFSEIVIEINTFSWKKMHLKLSSVKWQPLCLGLDVLPLQCPHSLWIFRHLSYFTSINLQLISYIYVAKSTLHGLFNIFWLWW